MAITAIRIHADCDQCGEAFSVGLDLAMRVNRPSIDNAHDLALDAVRGGLDYKDKQGNAPGAFLLPSVEENGWKVLCAACTHEDDGRHANE